MNYIKFKGPGVEHGLIKAVLNSSQASGVSRNYPKVSVIGRTPIAPDIDIMQVHRIDGSEKLVGFEVKVVKFREQKNKRIGLDWERIYAGIGEALLYLQFGLEQCGLILGFHQNMPDEKVESFVDCIKEKGSILTTVLGPYFTLGIFLHDKGGIYEITKATSDFVYYSSSDVLYGKKIEERIKNFRSNLLAKEVRWDKKLSKQCKYAEK